MKIDGIVWKDGTFWLAEVPFLDMMTQAKTKKEIPLMVKDAIESLIDDPQFHVNVTLTGNNIYIEANDLKKIFALILKRTRSKNNLTIEDVAARLNAKSINAYAQYEQAKHSPGFEKFEELYKAIEPDTNVVLTKR